VKLELEYEIIPEIAKRDDDGGWRKEEGRWIPKFRVEEYVYNPMYDFTNHDPVLYLNNGTEVLLIDGLF
jgi:hypothetical protein